MRKHSMIRLLVVAATAALARRPAATDRGCGSYCSAAVDDAVRVAVTRAAYANATAAALASARRVAARISLDCAIALRGDGVVVSHGGRSYAVGDALPAALVGGGGGALCAAGAAAAPGRVAVFTVVDTIGYLTAPGNLDAFRNKVAFCERTARPLYVLLVGTGDASLHAREGPPWQPCGEPDGNQLSVYKAPGALRVFESRPAVSSLLYLDADAWFADGAAAAPLEAYADLLEKNDADLLGVQNRFHAGADPGWGRPRKIVMNGGVFLLRRSAFADGFAGLWWAGRCGAKDQLPLWAALFAHWHVDAGAPYDPDAFATYKLARRAALPSLARVLGDRLPQGQLREPAVVGRVLLLPALPVGGLPALRSDRDPARRTFVCHTKPGRPEQGGQCDAADVCAESRC